MKQTLDTIKIILIACLIAVGVSYVNAAWNNPTLSPTGGNTSEPINVSVSEQTKSGILNILSNLNVTGAIGGNAIVSLTSSTTKSNANEFCLTGPNPDSCINAWPSGSGSSLTGSGTTNFITKWTGTTSLGNSIISDNGTTVTINGGLNVTSNNKITSNQFCIGTNCITSWPTASSNNNFYSNWPNQIKCGDSNNFLILYFADKGQISGNTNYIRYAHPITGNNVTYNATNGDYISSTSSTLPQFSACRVNINTLF